MFYLCRCALFLSFKFVGWSIAVIVMLILIFAMAIGVVRAYSYYEPIGERPILQKTNAIRV